MLNTITSPTLLISEARVRNNIQRMADRAARHNLALRPHFKTHQSKEVGQWFKELGIEEISVTSLRMAKEFADHGWPKITIAMPVNPREFIELQALSGQSRISVFLADSGTAQRMNEELLNQLPYFIELNEGYNRTGIPAGDLDTITAIIEAAGHHRCRGFYVHSGHTYDAPDAAAIKQIHLELLSKIAGLKKAIRDAAEKLPAGLARDRFIEPFEFSIGDTPACSTQEDYTGLTSIGPGNFVYYDLVQAGLGSCSTADIAVCLAAPVVQVFPGRGEAIIHGGWVQLGKDRLPDGTYGRIVHLKEDGNWRTPIAGASMIKLSQEHGTLRLPPEGLSDLRPGDLVGVLPVHACAMVHGMRATGEERVI